MNIKKSEQTASILIFLVLTAIFGSVYSPFQMNISGHIFKNETSQNYVDRRFEDQSYFPALPPKTYLLEHFKIIFPSLLIIAGLTLMLKIFGLPIITGSLFNVINFIFFLISFWLLITYPIQFLIMAMPICSSYIFAVLLSKNMGIFHRMNFWFLILWAQIIISAESLSAYSHLTAAGFLTLGGLVFLSSLVCAKFAKLSLKADLSDYRQFKNQLIAAAQQHPLIGLFLSVILFSLLWRLLLIISVPPNNGDGMAYHLTRVAFWIQHESMQHFHENNFRISTFPRNAEIMMLWTMISSKSDVLCGLIQFFSYLFSASLLYLCLKEYLKVEKWIALLVPLLWMTLPENVLQSTSIQNDMCAAYFLMLSLVYFLISNKEKIDSKAYVSASALGIAIGTKLTAFLSLIPFGIIFICFVSIEKQMRKLLIYRLLLYALLLVLLGGHNYLQNYIIHGNLFSTKILVDSASITAPTWKTFWSLFAQHLYNLLASQTGLQFYISIFADHYNNMTAFLGEQFFRWMHIPLNVYNSYTKGGFHFNNWILKLRIHEDFSFFGFVGAIISIMAIYAFILGIIKFSVGKKLIYSNYFLFAFVCVAYLAGISYKLIWDPWASRYLVTFILIGSPLLALLFQNRLKRNWILLQTILITYSIIFIIPATLMNERKPLTPYKTDINGLQYRPLNRPEVSLTKRNELQEVSPLKRLDAIGWTALKLNNDRPGKIFISEPYDEVFVRKYYSLVPPGSRVGTLLNFWQRQYPFFGEELTRTLVPLNEYLLHNEQFSFLLTNSTELKANPKIRKLIQKKYTKIMSLSGVVGASLGLDWITLYALKE